MTKENEALEHMMVPTNAMATPRARAFAAAEFQRIAQTHLRLSAALLELAGDAEAFAARRAKILNDAKAARQATIDALNSEELQ